MGFNIFNKKQEDKNTRQEKIDELRGLEMRLCGETIKTDEFKLNDNIRISEIEKATENMKRLLNIKDDSLRMIERYKKVHKDISKEDFYEMFENKQDADVFWIIWQKMEAGGKSKKIIENEERMKQLNKYREECISIVPGENEFVDLRIKWKNFIESVNDEQYLIGLKTYAEKFLSKDKIEKIIEPMFERHSKNITDFYDVYNRLSDSFENAEELRGSNIGKEMKKEIANIIYNRLTLKKF